MSKGTYTDKNGKEPKKGLLSKLKEKRELAAGAGGKADYATATPGWLAAAIIAITSEGGAIQFGYSRDGGVYTIVILMDGEMDKNYVKQSEGIDNFCEEIWREFGGEARANEPT
jgi:hypothetical protein